MTLVWNMFETEEFMLLYLQNSENHNHNIKHISCEQKYKHDRLMAGPYRSSATETILYYLLPSHAGYRRCFFERRTDVLTKSEMYKGNQHCVM